MTFRKVLVTAAVVCALALVSCSRPQPEPAVEQPAAGIRVLEIQVGRDARPDNTLGEITNRFGPGDTFFVAVHTEGESPSSTLKARWTYEDGQVVDEYILTIATTGRAATLLRADKPDGWPEGEYAVEVYLDGVSVGQLRFVVSE